MNKKLGTVLLFSALLLGGIGMANDSVHAETIAPKISINATSITADSKLMMTGKDFTIKKGQALTEGEQFDMFGIKVVDENGDDVTKEYKELLLKDTINDSVNTTETHEVTYYDQNKKEMGTYTMTVVDDEKPALAGVMTVNFRLLDKDGKFKAIISSQKLDSSKNDAYVVGSKANINIAEIVKDYKYVGSYEVKDNIITALFTEKAQTVNIDFQEKDGSTTPEAPKPDKKFTFKFVDSTGKQIISPKTITVKDGGKGYLTVDPSQFGSYTLTKVTNGVVKDGKITVNYDDPTTVTLHFAKKGEKRDVQVTIYDQDGDVIYNNKIQVVAGVKGKFDINIADYGNYKITKVTGATRSGADALILDENTQDHIKIFVEDLDATGGSSSSNSSNGSTSGSNSSNDSATSDSSLADTKGNVNTGGIGSASGSDSTLPKTGANLIGTVVSAISASIATAGVLLKKKQ